MEKIREYAEKFGRAEGIRFLKWCIKYKDSTRQILTPEQRGYSPIGKIEELELSSLSTVLLIMGLRRKEAQGILEVILDTDIEKLEIIGNDYIIDGILDHLNLIDEKNESKGTKRFKAFWEDFLKSEAVDQGNSICFFMDWFEKEWYEWEYICHEPHPKPEIIEELFCKITAKAIHDPSFLVVEELMRSKFYEKFDDEWVIKASIRATEEIDSKYGMIHKDVELIKKED